MKKKLLSAALVLCLLLALMPAAAAYTPEDCVNYYGSLCGGRCADRHLR